MSRATTTQRLDTSPVKSLESTTLPSMPQCTVPVYSLTWWRMDTQWHLIFSFMETGPNRRLCQVAPCSTSSLVTRCGSRWLCQSTMDFTPAARQTAPSQASWCTQTGKTLLCLHDVCVRTKQSHIPIWEVNHNLFSAYFSYLTHKFWIKTSEYAFTWYSCICIISKYKPDNVTWMAHTGEVWGTCTEQWCLFSVCSSVADFKLVWQLIFVTDVVTTASCQLQATNSNSFYDIIALHSKFLYSKQETWINHYSF